MTARSKAIRGLPVINLEDGSMAGRVEDLIIDPAGKKVAGLLVGEKGFLKGKHQPVPFQNIHSIGEDAVIIKLPEEGDLEEIHTFLNSLKDYSILGKSIISNEGNYIAKVSDFAFSPKTGEIESLLLYDIKGRENVQLDVFLTIDGIMNLGKDYILADANYTSYLTETEAREPEEKIFEAEAEAEAEGKREEAAAKGGGGGGGGGGGDSDEGVKETPYSSTFEGFDRLKEIWSHVEKEITRGSRELARETREKMIQYVKGKKVNYAVRDNQGHIIIGPGEVITEKIIQVAEAQDKIPALFLSAISEEIEESLNIIGKKISGIFR